MVTKTNYENEIAKYVDNIDNNAKDYLLRRCLIILMHPETVIETNNEKLEDEICNIECVIDEFNESYGGN